MRAQWTNAAVLLVGGGQVAVLPDLKARVMVYCTDGVHLFFGDAKTFQRGEKAGVAELVECFYPVEEENVQLPLAFRGQGKLDNAQEEGDCFWR